MNISMHAMSHGVFKKALTQLLLVMEKGVANAKARNFDTSVLVNSRLAPDMLPFAKQIQLTSDFAKNSMARLAGIDPPKFEDNETTMDELVARVKKTLDYIDSVSGRFARRQRDARHQDSAARPHGGVQGPRVPAVLGAAELLLPPRDGVQPAAPQRRRYRQAGLPRRMNPGA